MQTSKRSKTPRTRRITGPASDSGGAARYVLGLALLVPLAFVLVAMAQLPGTSLAAPAGLLQSDASVAIMGKRPASSNPAPPPTLVPPTATPRPTATPEPAAAAVAPTATPQKGGTYTVQPGDELKSIAAQYNVSIWKIIDLNTIPNPDSLKIGQELRIPAE
jgi:LysM repeat protein